MFANKKILCDPNFQIALAKLLRIKQICGKMDNCLKVYIDNYDVIEYSEINTYGDGAKHNPPVTDKSNKYKSFIYVQVHLSGIANTVIPRINEYLQLNRAREYSRRDQCGENLMRLLFGSNSQWKSFEKMIPLEIVDIIFDRVALHPMWTNDIVFHFPVPCNAEFQRLLIKEANRRDCGKPVRISLTGYDNTQIYQCPCGARLRVPKGKGIIIAHCPSCKVWWDIDAK